MMSGTLHYVRITIVQLAVTTLVHGGTDKSIQQPSAPAAEYCESETFRARCWSNEVVTMTSAKYGRMRIGRCVEADLGYLGCAADVLDLADRKCSGLRECEIRIPDSALDRATTQCYKELKVYMEASYKCMRVVSTDYGTCNTPLEVTQETNYLHRNTSLTSSKCSILRLHAQPGQQINITLVDFSWTKPSQDHLGIRGHKCINYGQIVDKVSGKNVTICGGGDKREHQLIITSNNTVDIVWTRQQTEGRFLLRYQAVGCPDLRGPKDAWLKRNGSKATVGCLATRQTWHLTCNGQSWIGVIGNCTQHLVSAQREARISQYDTFIPHGVAIVLIVGIAVIICVVIVSIGFACIRRYVYNRKLCTKRPNQIRYNNVRTDDDAYKTRDGDVMTISQKTQQPTPPVGQNFSKKNDYSHIWELPLPDPKQDRVQDGTYRGTRSTDSAYGTSLLSSARPGHDESYHVSVTSRSTDDSRYFVLDRDPREQCTPIPDDPEC